MYEELVKRLREIVPWECPLTCKNTMHEAADAIGELLDRIAASEATIKRQSDIIQAKDRDLQRAIDAKLTHTESNADRIRNMSDEEFSHFLFGIQCAPASRPKEWLDWLKQEAGE